MDIKDRLCVNNFPYRKYTFPYFLQSVQRLGLRRLELSGCHPHFTEYEAEVFDTKALAAKVRACGLKVAMIEPEQNFLPVNIASGQEYLWRRSVEALEFYIRSAQDFDCDKVIIYPGKGAMDQSLEDARGNSAKALSRLCGTARGNGVKLLLQNVSDCVSNLTVTLEDLKVLSGMAGGEGLYISIDTCALSAAGESLEDAFRIFGDRILNVQLSDSSEEGEHLIIGEGVQDFAGYLRALDGYGYQGEITLEITEEECADDPEDCYRESLEALDQVIEEVGL